MNLSSISVKLMRREKEDVDVGFALESLFTTLETPEIFMSHYGRCYEILFHVSDRLPLWNPRCKGSFSFLIQCYINYITLLLY